MLYKIMLVDDEPIIREAIKNRINWNAFGFECVLTCADGRKAIEKIEEAAPDIVLTDICMPFVDGLQLSEYIVNNFPHIKIILLSGYDDFNYAQKALQLKVWDYILKPISPKEMTDVLIKLKQDMDAERDKALEIKRINAFLLENKATLKEQFFNRLIKGELTVSEIENKINFFDLEFYNKTFLVAILDIDTGSNEITEAYNYTNDYTKEEFLYYSLLKESQEIISSNKIGVVFQNNNCQTVIIFYGNCEAILEKSEAVCRKIMLALEESLSFTVTVGLGIVVDFYLDICKSYKKALNALEYRFILGNNKIISAIDIKRNNILLDIDTDKYENEILRDIKIGNITAIENNIRALFSELRRSNFKNCYTIIQRLLLKIQQALFNLDIDITEIENFLGLENNLVVEIYQFKTLDEIEIWICNICFKISEHLLGKKENRQTSLVFKAKDFINTNFHDSNLNIDTICSSLNISSGYFSNIFKSVSNETLIEYLTRVRVEKAKELLLTSNLKTYEIANAVGYNDPHYFSSVFKKNVGETPKSYREGL